MEYNPIPLKNTLHIDKLFTIHYFSYAKDFIFTGEKHDFWEMAYIDNGDVGVVADGIGYTLRQGEAIFHKPNEYHSIWSNGKYAHVLILSFSSKSRTMSFFKNKILKLDAEDKRLLGMIIAEAREAFAEPLDIVDLPQMTLRRDGALGAAQLTRLYIEAFLIGLARKNSAVAPADRLSASAAEESEDKIVGRIKTYLKNHIGETVTLDDICAQLCFSKTYVKALFKKRTGTSIIQFFISLKLDRAKRMISEGDKTISEIAASCGFSSVHYFSRLFKTHTGMSPTAYAKSVQSRHIL